MLNGKIALVVIAVIVVITIGTFISKGRESDRLEKANIEQENIPSQNIDVADEQPYAWIGEAYSGKIGEPIRFDASGSYDPSGLSLTLYEWDFDADGVFEYKSSSSIATHKYDKEFNDFVVMRVTGSDGTALAKARTVVNAQGYPSQGDEESCELDENGYSIFIDEDGRFIPCTADKMPTTDKPGVTESQGAPGDQNQ